MTTTKLNVKVRSMMSPRTGNPVANQFIITVDHTQYFQSYNTVIAKKQYGVPLVLDRNAWDYSRTTSKYRNEFLDMTTSEIKQAIADWSIILDNLN